MKLSEEDSELFYKLNWGLMYYVNKKYPVIKELDKPDFKGQDLRDVVRINEKLFSHPVLIDYFIEENPLRFNQDELAIIKGWRDKFVKSEFFIFSIQNQVIFLSSEKPPKAYEVIGIKDEIKDILPFEPYICNSIILPFKGKITYSGFLSGYNISFGGGMKRTITKDFFKAKTKFGIISSLDIAITEKNESAEELLRFYLKDERNRYEYSNEIEKILKNNPELTKVYYQELGKANARRIRKKFSELKIGFGWFAILNDVIIASGSSKEETEKRSKELLPEDKRECIFVFQYKCSM